MSLPVWIVVANGSRARILERPHAGAPLVEIRDWVHPQTRQHFKATAGVHQSGGISGRSGLAPRVSLKERERAYFASDICQWLDQSAAEQRFGTVALFASNPFLGELLSHNGHPFQRHLSASHALDLTHLSLAEIDQRMRDEYRI